MYCGGSAALTIGKIVILCHPSYSYNRILRTLVGGGEGEDFVSEGLSHSRMTCQAGSGKRPPSNQRAAAATWSAWRSFPPSLLRSIVLCRCISLSVMTKPIQSYPSIAITCDRGALALKYVRLSGQKCILLAGNPPVPKTARRF